MYIAALALFIGAGPVDEVLAARDALPSMLKEGYINPVFVSFLGATEIDDLKDQVELMLHHATKRKSRSRPFIHKVLSSPRKTLYVMDADELTWKEAGVKRLLQKETYFRQVMIDSQQDYDVPIVRADWLLGNISFGKTYYDLLFDNPKTLSDIFKVVGLDQKSVAAAVAQHGSRVRESRVARCGFRVVTFLGYSLFGPVWITDDIKSEENKRPKDSVIEKIDKKRFVKPDAHEVIGMLPNGCLWFAITNDKDELQEVVPDTVAIDQRDYKAPAVLKDIVNERPNRRVTAIENPHTCMTCHALGMQPSPDWVSDAIDKKRLNITAYDRKTQGELQDFFSKPAVEDSIEETSNKYLKSVQQITNVKALTALNRFAIVRNKYRDTRLDLAQAAAEIDITPEDWPKFAKAVSAESTESPGYQLRFNVAYWLLGLGKKDAARSVLGYDDDDFANYLKGKIVLPLGSNTINDLATGGTVDRANWEFNFYLEAAILFCYQKKQMQTATPDMVRQRFKGQTEPEKKLPPVENKPPEPVKINYPKPRRRALDATTGRPIEFNETTGQWEFSQN